MSTRRLLQPVSARRLPVGRKGPYQCCFDAGPHSRSEISGLFQGAPDAVECQALGIKAARLRRAASAGGHGPPPLLVSATAPPAPTRSARNNAEADSWTRKQWTGRGASSGYSMARHPVVEMRRDAPSPSPAATTSHPRSPARLATIPGGHDGTQVRVRRGARC